MLCINITWEGESLCTRLHYSRYLYYTTFSALHNVNLLSACVPRPKVPTCILLECTCIEPKTCWCCSCVEVWSMWRMQARPCFQLISNAITVLAHTMARGCTYYCVKASKAAGSLGWWSLSYNYVIVFDPFHA